VCLQTTEPVAAPTKKDKTVKVDKPDDALLKTRLQEQDDKLVERQERLEQIKGIVENRQQPSENADFTAARNKLNTVRVESRRLLQVGRQG